MKDRGLSKDTWEDPTHSLTMIKEYEERLVKIFRKWRKEVLEIIRSNGHPGQLTHQLGKIDLAAIMKALEAIASIYLIADSADLMDNLWEEGASKGIMFSSIQLGQYGVDSPDDMTPEDWDIIKGFSAKGQAGVRDVGSDINKRILLSLSDAVKEGRNVDPELLQEIDDLVGTGDASARRIARTEIMDAVNVGAKMRYEDAGIETVEWLTVLDEKACTQDIEWDGETYAGCEELDGVRFPIDNHPPCPAHPNCRCTLIPVIEEKVSHE